MHFRTEHTPCICAVKSICSVKTTTDFPLRSVYKWCSSRNCTLPEFAAGNLTRAMSQIAFALLQHRIDDPLPIGKYCTLKCILGKGTPCGLFCVLSRACGVLLNVLSKLTWSLYDPDIWCYWQHRV